jgi:hypothetical protein
MKFSMIGKEKRDRRLLNRGDCMDRFYCIREITPEEVQ